MKWNDQRKTACFAGFALQDQKGEKEDYVTLQVIKEWSESKEQLVTLKLALRMID